MRRSMRTLSWLVVASLLMDPLPTHAGYRDTYKEGLQAYDRADWPEVARLMRQSIRENPKAGGRGIRVRGTRFEDYLPYYHLGVALYSMEQLDQALEAFEAALKGVLEVKADDHRALTRLLELLSRKQRWEEAIETILDACSLKEEGEIRAVVAVGCLVQRHGDELAAEIPEVGLFLGLTDLPTLVPQLRDRGLLADESETIPLMERPLRLLSTETRHTSYLKISEGCDHTCAFCAIPLMRGLHRSQPVDELVREAAGLHAAGVREINVVSQDTTWYGRDLRRHERDAPLLPDLLRSLVAGTDVPWFRLFYMYPSGITRELVELLASEDRILPYLDMPIQHGSDRILTLMRRPERRETIVERVGWLREAIPDLTLRTTVIVGFPGETDQDFREMLDLLEDVQFERVGAFTYSIEEGTRAADLPEIGRAHV